VAVGVTIVIVPPDVVTAIGEDDADAVAFNTCIVMAPDALGAVKNVATLIVPASMVVLVPSRQARHCSTPDPIGVQVISFPAAIAAAPGTTFTASMRAGS
jgi:hypothetical protein